jgi:DNA repair protein RecO (recombination protein O)
MNNWEATGLVLSARVHGENGLIISLLTQDYGRHVGYVPGGQSRSKRVGIEPGSIVEARWQSRLLDQMGTYVLEPVRQPATLLMQDPVRLAALQSACALCDTALPEREAHPALFHGFMALVDHLNGEMWGPAYVAWEIAFMKEMGFALDLTRCAAGGDATDLRYMSPKSGCAVSAEHGQLYKSRLLPLPEFLKPQPDMDEMGSDADVATGLKMTAYFLEHWVFTHHSHGMPEARVQLTARLERLLGIPVAALA